MQDAGSPGTSDGAREPGRRSTVRPHLGNTSRGAEAGVQGCEGMLQRCLCITDLGGFQRCLCITDYGRLEWCTCSRAGVLVASGTVVADFDGGGVLGAAL